MSMLLELYGTPAPIRTQYPTRQHPDCVHPRRLVQCPRCHDWSELTHNTYCHTCAIWLVDEQQPSPVATVTEPAAPVVAEPVVATIETSENATQAEPELTAAVNAELARVGAQAATPEEIARTRDKVLLPNVEQIVYFIQWNRRSDEQDTLIAELAFEAGTVVDRERYVAARSGKYVLLHQRADMLATDCSCGDRRFRGRRAGRCCKHMAAHNDMLKPATQQQQAA